MSSSPDQQREPAHDIDVRWRVLSLIGSLAVFHGISSWQSCERERGGTRAAIQSVQVPTAAESPPFHASATAPIHVTGPVVVLHQEPQLEDSEYKVRMREHIHKTNQQNNNQIAITALPQ